MNPWFPTVAVVPDETDASILKEKKESNKHFIVNSILSRISVIKKLCSGGTHDIIIIRNGHDKPSSNPGPGVLHFI